MSRRRRNQRSEPQPEPEPAPGPESGTEAAAGEPGEEEPLGFVDTLRATKEALAPIGHRRVMLAFLTVGTLSLGGVLLFTGVSFWWTSQPSFCGRCHVMTKYVDAWKASPHRTVNCERCHTPPGTFGFLGGKIAGLQVVLNYVRGHYDDTSFNASVANGNCLECHKGVLEKNVHTGDVVVSHRNIVETGGKCIFCHSTVAHGDAVPVGSHTEPSMAACLKCHNDRIAPLKCNLCHTARSQIATAASDRPTPPTTPVP